MGNRKEPIDKQCVHCGKTFSTLSNKTKYCCGACKSAVWNKYNKDKKKPPTIKDIPTDILIKKLTVYGIFKKNEVKLHDLDKKIDEVLQEIGERFQNILIDIPNHLFEEFNRVIDEYYI